MQINQPVLAFVRICAKQLQFDLYLRSVVLQLRSTFALDSFYIVGVVGFPPLTGQIRFLSAVMVDPLSNIVSVDAQQICSIHENVAGTSCAETD